MADNFNMKQFLMENKLGAYSRIKEVDEAEEKVEETVDNHTLGKVEQVLDMLSHLKSNTSTNSNIPTTDKQGLVYAFQEMEEVLEDVAADIEMEMNEGKEVKDYISSKINMSEAKEKVDEVDVRPFDYSGGLPTKKYRPYATTMEDIVGFVKKYPGITMKELALKAYGNHSGGKSNYDGKEKILQGAVYMIDRAVRADKIVKVKDIKVGKAVFTYFTPEDYQEFLQKKKSMNIGKIAIKEDSIEENYFTQEYIDRMEGLANIQDLATLKTKLRILTSDWMQEGFEKEDVVEYLKYLVNEI